MYEFRSNFAQQQQVDLIVHKNQEGIANNINPFDHGSNKYTDIMKTQGLKQALNLGQYDAAFGEARREEEKSRAKERIYSFRDSFHQWDQRISDPNCGPFTTEKSIKVKAFVYSLSRTGPSWISGNISTLKMFLWFLCTSRSKNAQWLSAMVLGL